MSEPEEFAFERGTLLEQHQQYYEESQDDGQAPAFNSHATARQADIVEHYEIEVDKMVEDQKRRELEEEKLGL